MTRDGSRPLWATRLGFVLAAAGSAVGLGNIWKFPYITGMNGGGAFVLVYLACVLIVGLPIMMAELMVGRRTRRNPVGAFAQLAGKRSLWSVAGWTSIVAAFIILSYYSVVAGWTLDYILHALTGSFSGRSPEAIEGLFSALVASAPRQLFWHFAFMALSLAIVIGGVQKGIERWNRILMPLLLLLILLLFAYSMTSPAAWQGIAFMFRPDFHRLTPAAILEAMGHAFFTLSLGMGAMITYGSYLSRGEDLVGTSLRVVALDTAISITAGLVIFPVVFSAGMEPGAGPGLVFKTIPLVFSRIPGGNVLALLFFVLLAFAALTSAISLLETLVAYLIDERGWERRRATVFLAALALVAGIPSALSTNALAGWTVIGERNFFDSADLLTSNYLLPAAGLLISVYVGWFWSRGDQLEELIAGGAGWAFRPWRFIIRFVSPVAVTLVLLFKMRETGLFAWIASRF